VNSLARVARELFRPAATVAAGLHGSFHLSHRSICDKKSFARALRTLARSFSTLHRDEFSFASCEIRKLWRFSSGIYSRTASTRRFSRESDAIRRFATPIARLADAVRGLFDLAGTS
jgi:hypothetical protein